MDLRYFSLMLQGTMEFLNSGRGNTVEKMAPHLTHKGVHDHGFNNLSTYGNLWRLMNENKIPHNEWEKNFYELALKVSGAVQAMRWTSIRDGGFIYSFQWSAVIVCRYNPLVQNCDVESFTGSYTSG